VTVHLVQDEPVLRFDDMDATELRGRLEVATHAGLDVADKLAAAVEDRDWILAAVLAGSFRDVARVIRLLRAALVARVEG